MPGPFALPRFPSRALTNLSSLRKRNRNRQEYMDVAIHDLNKRIPRTIGLTENDDVYFPNIEQIFEVYKNDKNRIFNELHFIEATFI
ncbi:hypothetical protein PPOLYM_02613 [Paenibacillus polymyxa]|nr:hypothetical protein PPOLYM_02613 [Paenibacillus polymyxa]